MPIRRGKAPATFTLILLRIQNLSKSIKIFLEFW